MSGKPHGEHIWSALPPKADVLRGSRHPRPALPISQPLAQPVPRQLVIPINGWVRCAISVFVTAAFRSSLGEKGSVEGRNVAGSSAAMWAASSRAKSYWPVFGVVADRP
jgi:hypothetical protein